MYSFTLRFIPKQIITVPHRWMLNGYENYFKLIGAKYKIKNKGWFGYSIETI